MYIDIISYFNKNRFIIIIRSAKIFEKIYEYLIPLVLKATSKLFYEFALEFDKMKTSFMQEFTFLSRWKPTYFNSLMLYAYS